MRSMKNLLGGPLTEMFSLALKTEGCLRDDLTVLSGVNDPFRMDTPVNRRDGQWLKEQIDLLYRSGERFHLRGLHYRLVSRGDVARPDGKPYLNNDDCWHWLVARASKAARWLGFVDFERLSDNRNDAPEIITREEIRAPYPYCQTGASAPDLDELELLVNVQNFTARQPWQIAIFGEKSSLKEPLLPLCKRYAADLYLCNGEISDTLIYDIAKRAAEDGRPLAMFTLSDFDPSGYQMPVSIAWKLHAFRILKFNDLRFHVTPVALTEAQAIDLDLPSTPLKETEKRADRWKEAFGREQTEIDALLALHERVFQAIVREAIAPYFDATLDRRVNQARSEWIEEAQGIIDEATQDEAGPWQTTAQEAAESIERAIEELDKIGRKAVLSGILPPIEVPEAELDEPDDSNVLASSDWSFAAIARALKARKAYDEGDAEAA